MPGGFAGLLNELLLRLSISWLSRILAVEKDGKSLI
jgi:hypothetical protein